MKILRLCSMVLCIVAACKPPEESIAPVDASAPATRAAASFVHCVEGGGSSCVRPGLNHGSWDAFYLLGWLGSGSPLSILQALPTELRNHEDPALVQQRFVREVERYDLAIRGAECDPATHQEVGPLIAKLAQAAQQRLEAFGLWNQELDEVVQGLAEEARTGFVHGYLVTLKCVGDPYRLYLATSDDGGRQQVVGLTTNLPKFLGGDAPDREIVGGRLNSRTLGLSGGVAGLREGTVDAWIPVPMEEF